MEKLASPDDTLSRYIYNRQDFNSNGVKYQAFWDDRNFNELSVCLTSGLSQAEMWELASVVRTDRTVKARADLVAAQIYNISNEQNTDLQVIIDGVPHPRHANIKFPPMHESIRRAIAADLAQRSTLVLPQ